MLTSLPAFLVLLALPFIATAPVPVSAGTEEIVLHAGAATPVGGAWSIVPDASAASGARLQSRDAGAAKVTAALAAPASYAELAFQAEAGKPYRLWIRGRAQNDSWANDSVYVQFSGTINASGAPVYRIGTTSGAMVNLEDGSSVGLSGWGWQDNGYGVGVLGPVVYFAAAGAQRLRIQVREDGFGIDQVVLSAARYLNTPPGTLKNDTTILAASGGSTGGEAPPPAEPPPPSPAAGDVVLYASQAAVRFGWDVVADATAAGGARLQNPNADAAKILVAAASPARYFELAFDAEAGRGYRLWVRGKAQANSWANDSVYVQFSGSVSATGAAIWRIGTTDAAWVNIEESSGAGLSGWGWQDNGYGASVLGPLVYFTAGGRQTLRVQVREDGLGIDQVVLSPDAYLAAAPGAAKNDSTILPQTGGTSTGTGITIVHAPYLQQVTSTGAVVAWATRESGTARVRYRTASGSDATVVATSTLYPSARTGMGDYHQHVARITGLRWSTAYTYDIELNGVDPLPGSHRLATAPAAGTGSMSFIAFGDSGTGSAAQQQLAAAMSADTFDIALHAGDLAYGSTDGVGGATHRTMTDWFFTTYRQWLSSAPMFPSIGNHDSRASNYDGRPYLDAFVLPAGAGAGAYPNHAERYYSFDYGPVHFVALDTELAFQDPARRAEQLAWLDTDLASSAAPWKIAYFHRSPFSAGGEHGSDLVVRSAFSPVFERHGVQLVISAHEHIYERTRPWRTGTSGTPVTYIVTGGGGGPLYAAGSAEWTAVAGSFHHYIKGTVTECTLTVDALTPAGAKADSVTLNRCGG